MPPLALPAIPRAWLLSKLQSATALRPIHSHTVSVSAAVQQRSRACPLNQQQYRYKQHTARPINRTPSAPFPAAKPSSSSKATQQTAATQSPSATASGHHDSNSAVSPNPALTPPARRKYQSPFTKLPTYNKANILLESALKKCHKLSFRQRGKSSKQYVVQLMVKRLAILNTLLNKRLQQSLKQYPQLTDIHPFDQTLIQLSLAFTEGSGSSKISASGKQYYVEVLKQASVLCHTLDDLHSHYSRKVQSLSTVKLLSDEWQTIVQRYTSIWSTRGDAVINELSKLTRALRNIPVINPSAPTIALVGCPNTGKSSIVRAISSGKPLVQNYSFTTRGIVAGHINVKMNIQQPRTAAFDPADLDSMSRYAQQAEVEERNVRIQVTDTPGLLPRHDNQRKPIEHLTLSVLQHLTLPPLCLNIIDRSGHCGYSLQTQLLLRNELRKRFPQIRHLDVYSKCDLPVDSIEPPAADHIDSNYIEQYGDIDTHIDNAVEVSTETNTGVDELFDTILQTLSEDAMLHTDSHLDAFQETSDVAAEDNELEDDDEEIDNDEEQFDVQQAVDRRTAML